MKITRKVKEILSWYESDNPGTKANIARLLMHGPQTRIAVWDQGNQRHSSGRRVPDIRPRDPGDW